MNTQEWAWARVRADAALDILVAEAEARGLERGLMVAKRIVGWLTRQPDSAWQREVRTWAEKAIAAERLRNKEGR